MIPASYYPMELRRYSDNPRTLSLLRSQQMPLHQVNLEQVSYIGTSPAMVLDAAYQPALPSPRLQLGTSQGPNQSTIEQAQRDVFALQRAADLRRADIAHWNQQATSPAMVPRSSPPATWAASSEAIPAPMAAQAYQVGAGPAQYFFANQPMELTHYSHGLQLQSADRMYNPSFQAVSQVDAPSAPQAAHGVQVYPAPLGPFHLRAPAAGEPIPPTLTGAPPPPAPSPPQGPPPGWM
jgi:hypothetical protein